MKKIALITCVVLVCVIVLFGTTYKNVNKDYLRIHIRANSNLIIDQNVKYEIKDAVVQVLTPLIAKCDSFESVKNIMAENLDLIDSTANHILINKGFNYTAKAKLCEEQFPERSYNGFVLIAGLYDAIIVELGEAKGDNWWCVVYPPLCFTNSSVGNNVEYRSRIIDMIEHFKQKIKG